MIELAQLKARVDAARRFELALGAVRFTLQVPSEYEVKLWATRARASGSEDTVSMMVEVSRAMLLAGVRGWSGVTVDHFLGDGDAEPVAFDAELVARLFDAQPDWAEPVVREIQSRVIVRRARAEAAEKN